MKMTTKWSVWLLLLSSAFSYAQLSDYHFQRELTGVKDTWHRVILPSEIFTHLNTAATDIRVFGITEKNDTIEAPYLLQLKKDQVKRKDIAFKILNRSSNANGHYFTFEVAGDESISEIDLSFEEDNFDWRVKLEGSQNQQEWFSVVEDYRILSIKNAQTNYKFTELNFPPVKYKFLRLRIENDKKPNLRNAKVSYNTLTKGTYDIFEINNVVRNENKQTKNTEILLDLKKSLPVSSLKINVEDQFDYYRPITIQYLADSIQTEKGWKYNYRTLTSGILNSIQSNEFTFKSTTASQLKLIIENRDNEPLSIDNFEAKGYQYQLVTRFTQPANYVLAYGNENAGKPQYDIGRFSNKLPQEISLLTLGAEKSFAHDEAKQSALFENKIWLWLIMGAIILLLGGFSLKMLRKS